MTRASTAAAQVQEPVAELKPKPNRIGLFRRYQLRRLGRSDGRFAIPDPLSTRAPLTTAARDQLLVDHDSRVIRLWETYRAEHATPDPKIVQIDNDLAALRQAAQTAIHELEAARCSPPNPNNPQFSPGEQRQHRSAEAVNKRRAHEHQQRIRDLERLSDSAAAAVTREEKRRATLISGEARQRIRTVIAERGLIATFKSERTIYDRALQRRHPLRELLRGRLDPSVPELSAWARAALNEAALNECGE